MSTALHYAHGSVYFSTSAYEMPVHPKVNDIWWCPAMGGWSICSSVSPNIWEWLGWRKSRKLNRAFKQVIKGYR